MLCLVNPDLAGVIYYYWEIKDKEDISWTLLFIIPMLGGEVALSQVDCDYTYPIMLLLYQKDALMSRL